MIPHISSSVTFEGFPLNSCKSSQGLSLRFRYNKLCFFTLMIQKLQKNHTSKFCNGELIVSISKLAMHQRVVLLTSHEFSETYAGRVLHDLQLRETASKTRSYTLNCSKNLRYTPLRHLHQLTHSVGTAIYEKNKLQTQK